MKWFLQHRNFQLGDFIMMTSGLKALSELWGEKINVFFETDVVKQLYLDCDFINILRKMPVKKSFASTLFSSWNHGDYRKKKHLEKEPMQACFFRLHAGDRGYKGEMPYTYADCPDSKKLEKENDKKYIAVFHGCLGDRFVPRKTIPMSSLQFLVNEILKYGYIPVILGDKGDRKRFWRHIKLEDPRVINYVHQLSIRDSASILSQCDDFISNDTGLYHVASAYKMKGLVLWNRTEFYKNAPSFSGIVRVECKKRDVPFYNNVITDYLKKI